MKCERCKERNAVIHLTKTENGQTHTQNLCEQCAMAEGILYAFKPLVVDQKKVGKKCPNCGLTEDVFQTKGLLGCSHCYDTFSDRIEGLLKGVQGASIHVGKTPFQKTTEEGKKKRGIFEKEAAERELKEAIREERYEDAALLRDRIKALNDTETAKSQEEK